MANSMKNADLDGTRTNVPEWTGVRQMGDMFALLSKASSE